MSIRPVDIQIAISKTSNYMKENNIKQQISNNQASIANELQLKTEHQQQQITSTFKSQGSKINKDQKKKHNNKNNKKRKSNTLLSKKDNKSNHAEQKQDKGLNIDISI